jgi:hypothetical protein
MPKRNLNRPPEGKQFKPSKPRINLTGRRFGKLTILYFVGRYGRRYFWRAQCDCGDQAVVDSANLNKGTRSCGCVTLARITKHGLYMSSEYRTWASMKMRCLNPKTLGYARYGGRGIKICDRWLDFTKFIADMGRKPSLRHSLDRINNDGDYEPSNCRWATPKEQAFNRGNNRLVTAFGITLPMTAWAERQGLGYSALRGRLETGLTPEEALSLPPSRRKYKTSKTL